MYLTPFFPWLQVVVRIQFVSGIESGQLDRVKRERNMYMGNSVECRADVLAPHCKSAVIGGIDREHSGGRKKVIDEIVQGQIIPRVLSGFGNPNADRRRRG